MKWIVAYVNGGVDARSSPEGNVPERKDGYGASPISLTELEVWLSEQG